MSKKKNQTTKKTTEKNANDPAVSTLFEKLEPFFQGVLVTMKQFNLADRAQFQNLFTEFLTLSGSNFYETFIASFEKRLTSGFNSSIDKMRDVPVDENFPKHIKDELEKWEYAKSAILVLFKPLDYAMANGAKETIEIIVKDKWNSQYLQTLNDTFNLTKTLAKIYSDSRRSDNKLAVLSVKNILVFYKRENLAVRGKVPLIKQFEDEFIASSVADYRTFATEFFKDGIHGFLPRAKQFVDDEFFRIDNGMDDDIGEKMKEKLKSEFLTATLEQVYEKYDEILEQDKVIEFQAITKMFEPIAKLDIFAQKTGIAFTKYCQEKIEQAMSSKSDFAKLPIEIVNLLFELVDRLDLMQQQYFLSNEIFKKNIDSAFKSALTSNKLVDICEKKDEFLPRVLANYTHMLLKKGSKVAANQDEIKQKFTKLGKIIVSVGNLDCFSQTYKRLFMERLIMDTVESTDLELYVITELASICDRTVSSQLHSVFNEYQKTEQTMTDFKDVMQKQRVTLPSFDMTMIIFSSSSMEHRKNVNFILPGPINDVFTTFSKYYSDKNTKKITLDMIMSHGIIQFSWMKRPIQIQTKLFQMGILMLFNETKELTFAELGEKTGLDSDRLASSISGIVSKGILVCSTDKEFKPDSVFKFNMSFKPRVTKFSVVQPDKVYLERERKETEKAMDEQLDEQRSYIIQAQQVRIMKMRKTMKFQDLVNETVENLRTKFNITGRRARKEIETLINGQYFKRSEEDREILEYLA